MKLTISGQFHETLFGIIYDPSDVTSAETYDNMPISV